MINLHYLLKQAVFTWILFNVLVSCHTAGKIGNDQSLEGNLDKTPSSQQNIFDRLIGTWQSKNGKNFERWTKNTDGTYRSDVYSLRNGDTLWKEQAQIYLSNKSWVFENQVKGQNEGKSVKFSSTMLTDDQVIFSNPAHDFPTDISYSVKDINTLNAYIAGPNTKGGRDTIPFYYKRF